MRRFGIIGNPVEQSFSARYFTEKFEREGIDAEYTKYKCETINEARKVLGIVEGCNVTIPHKQAIMALLDELDETAREIGAVNVVKREREGHLIGYNTDCIGFIDSIRPLLRPTDKKALILGTGGAAKAVRYGLEKLGVKPTFVSRKIDEAAKALDEAPRALDVAAKPLDEAPKALDGGMIGYGGLTEEVMREHTVIVNCTPVGMWPNVEGKPAIPYEYINSEHLLFDCIYNPEETEFLREGRERGAITRNGMEMLIGQAVAAWRIWEM